MKEILVDVFCAVWTFAWGFIICRQKLIDRLNKKCPPSMKITWYEALKIHDVAEAYRVHEVLDRHIYALEVFNVMRDKTGMPTPPVPISMDAADAIFKETDRRHFARDSKFEKQREDIKQLFVRGN